MSEDNRGTSGRGRSGAAGQSETHGHSPKSLRDEKDPNYERRTLPRHDEMPDLVSWETQAAGVMHRGNHHATEMDREGEQDEDYEDMASDMENEGGAHYEVKNLK